LNVCLVDVQINSTSFSSMVPSSMSFVQVDRDLPIRCLIIEVHSLQFTHDTTIGANLLVHPNLGGG